MSIRTTRILLIRNMLRGADRRHLARVLDRIAAVDLDTIFPECSALELRRAAAVLFDASRLQTTEREHSDAGLRLMLISATAADARRLLTSVVPKRAAALLLGIPAGEREQLLAVVDEDDRADIVAALPRSARPGKGSLLSVLRLRRLFA